MTAISRYEIEVSKRFINTEALLMRNFILLAVTTTIILFGCTKSDPPTPPNPVTTTDTNRVTISPSVYIAGDSFDISTSYLPYPVYWKNGKQVHLPHPGYSSATGIAVNNSEVYVSNGGGYAGNNVTYWKNSIAVNLADPSITYPSATAITLSVRNSFFRKRNSQVNLHFRL
jgi:hypothetical protein